MPTSRSAQTQFDVAAIKTLADTMVTSAISKRKSRPISMRPAMTPAAEWDFHNGVLGAKDQVIVQFGDDSNQVQSLGLKKKSEYKSPTTKNKPAPSPAPPSASEVIFPGGKRVPVTC